MDITCEYEKQIERAILTTFSNVGAFYEKKSWEDNFLDMMMSLAFSSVFLRSSQDETKRCGIDLLTLSLNVEMNQMWCGVRIGLEPSCIESSSPWNSHIYQGLLSPPQTSIPSSVSLVSHNLNLEGYSSEEW